MDRDAAASIRRRRGQAGHPGRLRREDAEPALDAGIGRHANGIALRAPAGPRPVLSVTLREGLALTCAQTSRDQVCARRAITLAAQDQGIERRALSRAPGQGGSKTSVRKILVLSVNAPAGERWSVPTRLAARRDRGAVLVHCAPAASLLPGISGCTLSAGLSRSPCRW